MHPTRQLGYLLHHLAFALDRQSDEFLHQKLGIGFSQYKIMMSLNWDRRVKQKQISKTLGQTEASISRQIAIMKEQGLISVRISPKNRRERIIELTPKGEELASDGTTLLNRYHKPMFDRLPPRQLAELSEMLNVMHMEVCKNEKPAKCDYGYWL